MENDGGISTPKIDFKKIIVTIAILFIVVAIVLAVMGWRAGLFTSTEALNAFLTGMGPWAPIAFLAVQVLQVIIPVIPGGITLSVSVIAFGPFWGFVYNYLGIVLGSYIAFVLARRFGVPLIKSIVSEKSFEKYIGWLDKGQSRFNKLFALAIFLPVAPDDLLCMLAGISKMKTSTFWLILLVCKIPFLLPYSLGLPTIMNWLGM